MKKLYISSLEYFCKLQFKNFNFRKSFCKVGVRKLNLQSLFNLNFFNLNSFQNPVKTILLTFILFHELSVKNVINTKIRLVI